MVLSNITLKNFRKHLNTNLKFSAGLNYIIGGNGEGKTSVLEAIYYLCTSKNFGSSDSSVVNFKENEFEISGSFESSVDDKVKVVYVLPENKKYYLLNGKNISRGSDIIGRFPVVLLTPADHSITQEGPSERRRFVDSVISQASGTYLLDLLEYNRTIRQRGTLLGKIKETRRSDYLKELDAWSSTLIKVGCALIHKRIKFIQDFKSFVNSSYQKIMNSEEVPDIKYIFLEGYEEGEIEKRYRELIEERREEEIRRGINLIGPHRDEFVFEVNGLNLKMYGSQGQHKTFQVVLRFAEFFYLKETSGKTPVFMLDDVFGELDISRSERISTYLREVGQAFITMTDFTNIDFIRRNTNDSIIKLKDALVAYA